MVSDKRTAALDQSLSELNLVSLLEGDRCAPLKISILHQLRHRTNTEVVWRTISDFQKDPYTTGLSIFSKITDKILFRWVLSSNFILLNTVPINKLYFQPCGGTAARGRDGRTASGGKHWLISWYYIKVFLHFFLGLQLRIKEGQLFRDCLSIRLILQQT